MPSKILTYFARGTDGAPLDIDIFDTFMRYFPKNKKSNHLTSLYNGSAADGFWGGKLFGWHCQNKCDDALEEIRKELKNQKGHDDPIIINCIGFSRGCFALLSLLYKLQNAKWFKEVDHPHLSINTIFIEPTPGNYLWSEELDGYFLPATLARKYSSFTKTFRNIKNALHIYQDTGHSHKNIDVFSKGFSTIDPVYDKGTQATEVLLPGIHSSSQTITNFNFSDGTSLLFPKIEYNVLEFIKNFINEMTKDDNVMKRNNLSPYRTGQYYYSGMITFLEMQLFLLKNSPECFNLTKNIQEKKEQLEEALRLLYDNFNKYEKDKNSSKTSRSLHHYKKIVRHGESCTFINNRHSFLSTGKKSDNVLLAIENKNFFMRNNYSLAVLGLNVVLGALIFFYQFFFQNCLYNKILSSIRMMIIFSFTAMAIIKIIINECHYRNHSLLATASQLFFAMAMIASGYALRYIDIIPDSTFKIIIITGSFILIPMVSRIILHLSFSISNSCSSSRQEAGIFG